MSGRQTKKLRREMRKHYRKIGLTDEKLRELVQEKVDAQFEDRVNSATATIAALYEARLRPRPRYCPGWVWQRIVARVIAPPPGQDDEQCTKPSKTTDPKPTQPLRDFARHARPTESPAKRTSAASAASATAPPTKGPAGPGTAAE